MDPDNESTFVAVQEDLSLSILSPIYLDRKQVIEPKKLQNTPKFLFSADYQN